MSGGGTGDAAALSGGSNHDGRGARPKVQQLRPTNKDVAQVPVAAVPAAAGSEGSGQAPAARTGGGSNGARVVPRIQTGAHGSGSAILVNSTQTGNPLLKHLKNVGWQIEEIVPDYQMGVSTCALFLSIRYHRVHPEYIHTRISKLSNMYTLRVLLLHCDVDQPDSTVKELTKLSIINNLTMLLAWNLDEAASYLERFKTFEHKPADLIRERGSDDYMGQMRDALTQIRGVNKTDVVTLTTQFGSFKDIAMSSAEQLAECPGMGEKKIRRIREVFQQPFRIGETRSGRERRAEREAMMGRDAAMELASREAVNAGSAPVRAAGNTVSDLPANFPRRPVLRNLDGEADGEGAGTGLFREATSAATSAPQPATTAAVDTDEDEIEEVEDDEFDDILADLTEEEQLQLALEMSRSAPNDDE